MDNSCQTVTNWVPPVNAETGQFQLRWMDGLILNLRTGYPSDTASWRPPRALPCNPFFLALPDRYSVVVPLPEKALISRIRRRVRPRGFNLVQGIGDDCAALRLPAGHEALITTDFTLEGVHFRREWHAPEVVGRRCLTRGLSDIAAMGGCPIAAFLSLALPHDLPQRWVDRFLEGLLQLADEFAIPLAGGDTAESRSGILVDIVVLGSVPRGQAILRFGARPGDSICVSGELGGASAALQLLFAGEKICPQDFPRHFHPTPRIAVGEALRGKATSMIDLSDGLSTDLAHICEESGVGAEIEASQIPRAKVGTKHQPVALDLALHGGEDYELLFTAPARKPIPARLAGVPIHRIGRITSGSGITLVQENGKKQKLKPAGWEHFRNR
jgi:thiamine-monophosphate kinase